MLALPSQTPGLAARHGLTRQETDRSAWAIDRAGHTFEGAAAINRALSELRNPWPAVASLYGFPPVRLLERGLYRAVAGNRHRLSALTRIAPECDDPGVHCEQD